MMVIATTRTAAFLKTFEKKRKSRLGFVLKPVREYQRSMDFKNLFFL